VLYHWSRHALQLWNQRSSACSRLHVLLPAQQQLSLAPTSLALQQQQVQQQQQPLAAGSNGGGSSGSSVLSLTPGPLAELGLQAGEDNVTVVLPNATAAGSNGSTAAATAAAPASSQWPPPGGERVECPVEIRGVRGQQQMTRVDAAFTRDLFSASGPNQQQTDAATVGAAATAAAASLSATSGGVLRFDDIMLTNLPQGEAAAAAAGAAGGSSGSSGDVVMPLGGGENAWASLLPAGAFTHLLWFVKRWEPA